LRLGLFVTQQLGALPEAFAIDLNSFCAQGKQIPCVVRDGNALLLSRISPHHEQSRLI
jgi:hypothetical protein